MIVRCWWPLQQRVHRDPAFVHLFFPGLIALLAWQAASAAHATPTQLPLGLAVAAALAVASWLRLGPLIGCAGAIALGALVPWALPSPTGGAPSAGGGTIGPAVLIAVGGVLLAPVAVALAGVRTRGQLQRAAGRAASWLTVCGQALMVGLTFIDWRWALGAALAIGAGLLWPMALTRVDEAEAPPSELPREPGRLPLVVTALIGLLALAALWIEARPAWRPALFDDARLRLVAATCLALWTFSTCRVRGALVAAVTVAAAGLVPAGAAVDPLLAALALLLGQAVPLALRMARESVAGWPAWTAALLAALLAATLWASPLLRPTLLVAAGGVSACALLALLPAPRPRAGAGDALARSRRWWSRLEPYWRFYGRAKLAMDPLYRQLADQPRPWGRVIDAGCGPGLVAALGAARGDVTAYRGVDLDLDKLLVARRVLAVAGRPLDGHWRLVHAGLPLPGAEPTCADTVLLLDVLHYWPEARQRALLAQLAGLLVDGGVLYLRDGLAGSGDDGRVARDERFTTFFGLNPGDDGLHFLTDGTMRALIAGCGLAIDACLPSGGANRLWICRKAPAVAARPPGLPPGEADPEPQPTSDMASG